MLSTVLCSALNSLVSAPHSQQPQTYPHPRPTDMSRHTTECMAMSQANPSQPGCIFPILHCSFILRNFRLHSQHYSKADHVWNKIEQIELGDGVSERHWLIRPVATNFVNSNSQKRLSSSEECNCNSFTLPAKARSRWTEPHPLGQFHAIL